MDKLKAKGAGLKRRQRRVRGKISGTAARPRLRVTRSNNNIYAQVIDDVAGKTLIAANTLQAEFIAAGKSGATIEGASTIGEIIGKRAVEAGVTEVVFDRGGHVYHGRIQALADGARNAGLKF